MWGTRLRTVLLVAVLASPTAACVAVRNVAADRELVCRDVPDELCLRIADVGLAVLDLDRVERQVGPVPTLQVYPEDCPYWPGHEGRRATRCWMLEATNEENGGSGVHIYGWPDGSLSTEG